MMVLIVSNLAIHITINEQDDGWDSIYFETRNLIKLHVEFSDHQVIHALDFVREFIPNWSDVPANFAIILVKLDESILTFDLNSFHKVFADNLKTRRTFLIVL